MLLIQYLCISKKLCFMDNCTVLHIFKNTIKHKATQSPPCHFADVSVVYNIEIERPWKIVNRHIFSMHITAFQLPDSFHEPLEI